jgi:hypothetical protein
LDAVMPSSSEWDVERMRPLVLEWDAAVRAEVPAFARLLPEAEARGSVLRGAASERAIAAAEARLGIEFPPSYRSFLSIANGADAGRFGADAVRRLSATDPNGLLRVEDVVALADIAPDLVPMWRDAMVEFADRQAEPSAEEPTPVYDFAPGTRALLLTRPVQYGIVALVPFPGEWQVWEFDHSEIAAHQSFAAFLQHKAGWARRRVAAREERVRAAVADGSSAVDVWTLADRGDPRAVDAACLALRRIEDPTERDTALVVGTLISLGDAKAIPDLRAALTRATDDHLQFMLLQALDSCGAPDAVVGLKRLVDTASTEQARFAASYLERRDELPRW